MKTRDYYITPKSSALMRTFWKAAGGDRYLLERATYSDQIKYMCLGGIVIATGAMATLAGGYAFYTIFEPKGLALENYVLQHIDPATLQKMKPGEKGVTQMVEILHYPTVIKSIIFVLYDFNEKSY